MITLQRLRLKKTENGTFGVLSFDDVPFALSIELPWKDNVRNQSCIPMGHYKCCRVWRSDGTQTFRVMNVPDRDDILFHRANTIDDLRGCIGVAEEFGMLNGKPAVLGSGRGFGEFMKKLEDANCFDLEIC
jgi:hypothetical protein